MREIVKKYAPTNSANISVATVSGGTVAIILVWVVQQFGVEMPTHVAVAFGSLLVGLAGSVGPNGK